jgi:hypothetical protein
MVVIEVLDELCGLLRVGKERVDGIPMECMA